LRSPLTPAYPLFHRYPRLAVAQFLSSGFNTQPAPAPGARLSNDYFHVTPKGSQQTQETVNRIFPEVPPKKSGHVGLRQTEHLRCLELG
jgi:hypothetical protein